MNDRTKEIEKIIFGDKVPDYSFGFARFSGLTAEWLTKLIGLGAASLCDSYNNSPLVSHYLDFMQTHKGVTAHGTLSSPERGSELTIEGLECCGDTDKETIIDFANAFYTADEFSVSEDRLYCWYD